MCAGSEGKGQVTIITHKSQKAKYLSDFEAYFGKLAYCYFSVCDVFKLSNGLNIITV